MSMRLFTQMHRIHGQKVVPGESPYEVSVGYVCTHPIQPEPVRCK